MYRQDYNERFGELGEEYIAQELTKRGYHVEHNGHNSPCDILVNHSIKIEVKCATVTRHKNGGHGWQFCLQRHGLTNTQDLIALVLYDRIDKPPIAVFLVPGIAIKAKQKKLDITSKDPSRYTGKYAIYRDNWGIVKTLAEWEILRNPRTPDQDPIPF